jgi:hypothetical protein
MDAKIGRWRSLPEAAGIIARTQGSLGELRNFPFSADQFLMITLAPTETRS